MGNFMKERPPTFNIEVKLGKEVEAYLLIMKKYFQVHECSRNMKDRIFIFNLTGRASIWRESLRQVKGIKERNIVQNKFKKKCLSKGYYDSKRKELHELKFGQLPMEEYVNKLLKLLRYVDYITNEKIKIQRFLSGFLQKCKDIFEFVDQKTLDEVLENFYALLCAKKWKIKSSRGMERQEEKKYLSKEEGLPFRNQPRNFQEGQQAQSGGKLAVAIKRGPRGPLQCQGCGENCILKYFPHKRQNPRGIHNIG